MYFVGSFFPYLQKKLSGETRNAFAFVVVVTNSMLNGAGINSIEI